MIKIGMIFAVLRIILWNFHLRILAFTLSTDMSSIVRLLGQQSMLHTRNSMVDCVTMI